MANNREIWVFSEKPALLAELIAGGRSLVEQEGDTVAALVIGGRAEAEEALARGADRAIWLGELPEGRLVEDTIPTLIQLVEEQKPAIILVGATMRGKVAAGRLAARLGITAITDIKQLTLENGELQARHMIFGGGAVRVEKPLSEIVLATVGLGVFAAQAADASRSGEIYEASFVEPEWRITLRERRQRGTAAVNLAGAKRVVCPGRGVARQEDLAMINELAQALNAEVACTRPLAEGLDWLPRERYIGISGANIRPDLYLGVGVSGQVQHMIGMRDSRVVAAINKDKEAPIFAQADYGIVGDLYEIVPALIKAIKERR